MNMPKGAGMAIGVAIGTGLDNLAIGIAPRLAHRAVLGL